MSRRVLSIVLLAGALALFFILAGISQPATAAPGNQANPPDPNLSISDEICLGCHGQPGQVYQFEDGSSWELYVPEEAYQESVHGELGYACVQCHRQIGNYPHAPFEAADLREAQLKLNDSCQFCHTHQYELANDSVHAAALENGNREAALCVDCHTAHDVRRLNDPETHTLLPEARVWIPQTCSRCHSNIYDKYKDSVHGSALIGEGNLDVPTCIDCHGVHNIEDPTTTTFRLSSPEMCGKCHSDASVVGKYGLSTEVLDTYVADFHGTTVILFEKQHHEEQTNKPVCYDCHGIHDITSADDPKKGLAVRQNLLVRCQECHPNATENFPDSWLSHYIPTPEKHPAVYYVNLFYKFFIPGVLGGMGILVAMDFSRRSLNWVRESRRKIRKDKTADTAEEQTEFTTTAPEMAGEGQVPTGTTQIPEPEEAADTRNLPETDAPPTPTSQPAEDETDPNIENNQHDG